MSVRWATATCVAIVACMCAMQETTFSLDRMPAEEPARRSSAEQSRPEWRDRFDVNKADLVPTGANPYIPMQPGREMFQYIDEVAKEKSWRFSGTILEGMSFDSTSLIQSIARTANANGITLYTIQVNTGGDPTSTLLQNCASTSDKFFLLTTASQILTTFNAIGTNLTKLRISK